MNVTLTELEKWLNELGITTKRQGEHVLANRMDISQVTTEAELLSEIKTNVNKRVFVAESTVGWLFLGCI